MSLSFTRVYTKKSEYSEFERDLDTVDIVVYFDKDQVQIGDSFTVELRKARRNKDEITDTQTYTFSGTPSVNYLQFQIDLPTTRTSDSIRLVRRGWYFIHVEDTSDDSNYVRSDDFKISLISVDRMREQWLHGLPLYSSDVMKPLYQPRRLSGITIVGVTYRHPAATYVLTLNVRDSEHKWLSWAGGMAQDIDLSHPIYPMKEYFINGEIGTAGLRVVVDPLELPTSDVSEHITIEAAKMNDDVIQSYVDHACDFVENSDLQIFLEPTLCVSEIDPAEIDSNLGLNPNTDYDRITPAVSYYGVRSGHWADIQFPFQHLLQIDYLMGAIANNQVISVATEWAEKNSSSGFVQLVPLQMEMAFNYLALMWAPSLWGIRDLPNFWHYRALAGLREVPADLIELIARRSAISILSVAGQGYKGGYAAQSISREGVAENVSYTSSAMYGIYSAYITDHRNWIEENIPKLRNKYRGIVMRCI